MPRWALWLPVGALVVLSAVLGWRQGWLVANVDESAVIALYAERYLSDRAAQAAMSDGTADGAPLVPARPEDCRAQPSPLPEAWLVVICGPDPHDPRAHYTYYVDRTAGLVRVVGPTGQNG